MAELSEQLQAEKATNADLQAQRIDAEKQLAVAHTQLVQLEDTHTELQRVTDNNAALRNENSELQHELATLTKSYALLERRAADLTAQH